MAKKRKNGDGSWDKKEIGGILYVRYRKTYPELKYPKEFYGKTQKAVMEKVKTFENNNACIVEENISKILFGEYIKNWINTQKKSTLKPKVYDDYMAIVDNYIMNNKLFNIGSKQMGQLNEIVFQKHIDSMSTKYARSTIAKTYTIISQCLKYARRKKHISEDFTGLYHIPSENNIIKKKKSIVFLTKEDVQKLYIESQQIITYKNKTTKNKYGNNGYIIILLLSTGMRVNECLARKWKDYDVVNHSLVVNSTMSRKKNTSLRSGELKNIKIETTPKTQSGIRIIPLSEMSIWAIKQLELQNPNHKPSDYICLNSSGIQCGERPLSATLNNMIKASKCSIDKCNIHALRHTFASILVADGVNVKVISELLGHKDVTTTYNIYVSLFQEQKMQALESFNLDPSNS